jgi:hypothetical protein
LYNDLIKQRRKDEQVINFGYEDQPSASELAEDALEDQLIAWCEANDLDPDDEDVRAEFYDDLEYMKNPMRYNGLSTRDFLA